MLVEIYDGPLWMMVLLMQVVLTCLCLEWRTIGISMRVEKMSLADVERNVTRLPKHIEIFAVNALTLLLMVCVVQFVSKVYAMTITLYSSTLESNKTQQVVMFDMENDGDLDYFMFSPTGGVGAEHIIYENDGNGTFTQHQTFQLTIDDLTRAAVGDINRDGFLDIVFPQQNGSSCIVRALMNSFGATFTSTSLGGCDDTTTISAVGLVDFDNDNDLDLAITKSSGRFELLVSNSAGTAFTSAASTLSTLDHATFADINSDGYIDILGSISGAQGYLQSFRNSGTGAFVKISETYMGVISAVGDVRAADIDGDGDIDAVADFDGSYTAFTNNGAGAFTAAGQFSNATGSKEFAFGDMDNDGDFDMVSGGFSAVLPNTIFTNTAGVFTDSLSTPADSDVAMSVAIGDIDNDNDLDFITGNGWVSDQAETHFKSDQSSTVSNGAPTAPSSDFIVDIISQNNRLTNMNLDAPFASLAMNPLTNQAAFSYYYEFSGDLRVAYCNNDECTNITNVSVETTNNVGTYNSMKIASDGTPMIAYYDTTNGDLLLSDCTVANCTSTNFTRVDSTGDVGVGAALAIGNDGYAVIAYMDNTNNRLKVAKCNDATCSSSTISNVATTTGSENHGIAIDGDGVPVITYWKNTDASLHMIKCGNASCSSGNTDTTIETDGGGTSFGYYSSIVVPLDFQPVISYSNDSSGHLKVVKCGNAACSSGNTTNTLDTTFHSGNYNDIALAEDGMTPIISYIRANRPWIAVCADTTCTPAQVTKTQLETTTSEYTSIVNGNGRPNVISIESASDEINFTRCGSADCSDGGTDGVSTYRLRWGSGSDSITPTRLLQYEVQLGLTTDGIDILPGVIASPNWTTRLVPNGQSRTRIVKNLACDDIYYWKVSAIDSGFKHTESAEQIFTLEKTCAITGGGGGTTGGTSGGTTGGTTSGGGTSGGGTRSPLFFEKKRKQEETLSTLVIKAFEDLNSNAVHDEREQSAADESIKVTASGTTALGNKFFQEFVIEGGSVSLELPIPDETGYELVASAEGLEIYEPVKTLSGILVVKDEKTTVEMAFSRTTILRYSPCLSIGEAIGGEAADNEAEALMQRLQDPYKTKIINKIELKDNLVTRKEFFQLLQRSQCIELVTDTGRLASGIEAAGKVLGIKVPFIDLRLDMKLPDAILVYSLLLAGTDVSRTTLIGSAADLSSPITRFEAIKAVSSVLNVPEHKRVKDGGILPLDLPTDDPNVEDFLTLQKLGVLPDSFLPVLGGNLGLTANESIIMILRAAFTAGKIDILPAFVSRQTAPSAQPTFLAELPEFSMPSCLERNTSRSSAIEFTDVRPGEGLYYDLRELLSFGTKNSAGNMLWLIPGTRRPTEFGVLRGNSKLEADEPVSILEVVRSLLILGCVPPQTKIDVLSGRSAQVVVQGSAESRIPRDRISDLPRDDSLASRVLYRAQDHQREYDLSLFTYAPELIRGDQPRSPSESLTVEEASKLLASALLMIAVKEDALSPLEAENMLQELSSAIAKDILGAELDWRDEATLKSTVLTRRMLLKFLATTALSRTTVTTLEPSLSIGEVWWERIK